MSRASRLGALATLLLASPLPGQVVRGILTEAGTGVPLVGALVSLLPGDGDSVAVAVLTGAGGRFALRAAPGRWRLRAEAVGHGSVEAPAFELAAGEEREVALAAAPEALRLDPIAVRAASRGCAVQPTDGGATARLWREARKALENASWARDREVVGYEAVLYERSLDPTTLQVRAERSEDRRGSGSRPFRSLPPEALVAGGFVQRTDSGTYYFAPDEDVLLSDVFLAGHCFRARTSDDHPELVGLAFEPVRRSDRVDIEGVLWLDAIDGELRRLEYRYANLALDVPTDRLGGAVWFQRLPTGAWIARRWWIRMPEIELRRTARAGYDIERSVLTGIRERGGEVLAVETRRGGRIANLDRPRVQGVVYDSARGRTLAGAEVYLVGTGQRVRADDDGRFTLAAPPGDFLLSFRHPRLDTLGLDPPDVPLALREGVVRHVRLTVPAVEVAPARAGGPGRILGRVTDAESAAGVAGAVVRVEGTESATLTDAEGAFRLDDVPSATRLLVVEHVAYGRSADSVRVAPDSILALRILLRPGVIALEPLTVTVAGGHRTAGLQGFHDRAERGIGYFLTAEQIRRRQARDLSEVLRAIPGLDVICGTPTPAGSGCTIQFERARAMGGRGRERVCPVQYFLDGTTAAREIVEAVRPEAIAGIEVYNGLADLPPLFRRGPDTRCGVVAVWLRAGG